jgi:photosystem II stability/assembly factor-like uncharacterized protein
MLTTSLMAFAALIAADVTVWQKLPTEPYRGKQDDISMVDARVGMYVNGAGRIFRTDDGGDSWRMLIEQPGTFFRCIAMLDHQRAFAGNIGPDYFPGVTDSKPLYATIDGGTTWNAVEIGGAPVVGLCALEVVRVPFINAGNLDHKTLVVGGGRVGGPAVFIKSLDEGQTWTATDLSTQAGMVLDVHFFDDQTGVIAAATDRNIQVAHASILRTTDGGTTWIEVYRSTRPFESTWKISFPTRDVGYVTVQSYNPDPSTSQRFVAKTTDGGLTWTEIPLIDDLRVRAFGVAFVTPEHGFVGAMPNGFETRDGGATWQAIDFGNAVNKIRVVREGELTRLYAIGVGVYRAELNRP